MGFDFGGGIFVYQDRGTFEMRKRIFPAFLVLAVLSLSGCSKMDNSAGEGAGMPLTPGQKFTLKNLEGQDVRLEDQLSSHRAVLLDFWATWCAYCVEEMPNLIKLQQKHAADGFTIIGVNAGESAEVASSFAKKAGMNFPVVLDSEMTVAQEYGLVGIPTSILIASDGTLLGKYYSFTRRLEADVARALEAKNA